ncbi:YhgE/Pip domain-containing protein [Microbacterium betulae]|uniref:YhgE/Pip domain-containing protein n=1 Tax=Microbacterium betulae TaxID=2981139 RepID=A0AA97FI06_9MICO|nr:YhgE/Pip domain-containing protein [Microbacterium sp. AB]WOF23606.1 YhgE/Pip domain-containing protein [Microbacterium sp. AB]
MTRARRPLAIERAQSRRPVTWLTLAGVLLLPALIGGVLVAALDQPTERLDNMTAAIVNDDDGTEVDGQTVPLGRQLAAGLVEGSDDLDSNLDWVISNDDDAAEGLADGTYQAVITIPEDFSASALSSSKSLSGEDADPTQATIDVTTAPDARIVDGAITNQIASVAASTLGSSLSESTLENVFVSFTTLGEQLGEAADGATQLADGATEAQDGAGQLSDGATQLADGIGQLGDGAGELSSGAGELAGGANEASAGASQLSDGAGQLSGGVAGLQSGAGELATGAGSLADGATQLAGGATEASGGAAQLADGARQSSDGAASLAEGATQVSDGAAGLKSGADALAAGLATLADGTHQTQQGAADLQTQLNAGADRIESDGLVPAELTTAADGSAQATAGVAQGLAALSEQCAVSGAAPEYCAQLAALVDGANTAQTAAAGTSAGLARFAQEAPAEIGGQLRAAGEGAGQLSTALTGIAQGADASTTGAGELAGGAGELAGGAGELAGGATALADGVGALAGGADELAGGVGALSGGAAQLSDGAAQLSDGSSQLADGAGQAESGASELSTGADELATGIGALAGGATQLASGAGQLEAGTVPLGDGASGLATGAAELGDGIGQLGDGATTLGDGLSQASESLPSYSDDEASDLASVVADPVSADASALELFGASAIPLLVTLVLWFGSLATFVALRSVTGRALTSRRPSALLAAGALLPAALVGAAQGAIVAVIVQLTAEYDAATFAPLLGLSALVGVAFAAVNQALVALFGGAGRWIAAIVGTLALATSVVSTIPGALGDIAGVLPTAPAYSALLALIADSGGMGGAIAGLVLWTVIAFVVTTFAVVRERTVSTKAVLAG